MNASRKSPQLSEPRSITIEYEGSLPLAVRKNRGNQSHWRYRAKETKNLRETGWWLIAEALNSEGMAVNPESGSGFARATILVTQHWCGKALDVSGLASASAPLVDAFMDAGVIEDDGPLIVEETRFKHVRVAHRTQAKIVIKCEEILDG